MQRLLLIDGSGYFYRAFWAVKGLSTSAGLPTNAIFGFTNMLIRLLKEYPEDQIVMVFDAPGPTFRHEEYSKYKANRDAMPEELAQQIAIGAGLSREVIGEVLHTNPQAIIANMVG